MAGKLSHTMMTNGMSDSDNSFLDKRMEVVEL